MSDIRQIQCKEELIDVNSQHQTNVTSLKTKKETPKFNISDLDKQDEFWYRPYETCDITIIFDMVDIYGNNTGEKYKFYVHKQVLASNCNYFEALFSTDTHVSEVIIPKSFIFHRFHKNYVMRTNIQALKLVFDSLYNIPDKSWWLFTSTERQNLLRNYNNFIIPAFYCGYSSFLMSIDIEYAQSGLSGMFSIIVSQHFKLKQWEEYIVCYFEDAFKTNRKITFEKLFNKYDDSITSMISPNIWNRFLRAACFKNPVF